MPDTPSPKHWLHPNRKSTTRLDRPARASRYVELQMKSNFSFLRGASHPEELIERAVELGYDTVGICDLNSLAGVVRAHVAAKQQSMPLLIGAHITPFHTLPDCPPEFDAIPPEALTFDSSLEDYSLIVYPHSKRGYAALATLLTRGKSRAPKGHCFLTNEDILTTLTECSLITCITKHHSLSALSSLRDAFGKDLLSLAISNTYGPDNERRIHRTRTIARTFDIPLVVTNDVLFHTPERKPLQDILTCIRRGKNIDTIGFELHQNHERYLKSPQEMERLFRHFPDALLRTNLIREQCAHFSLDQLHYEYPREICPAGLSPMEHLRNLTWEGARERYPNGVPESVLRQIEHEFTLIEELNYPKYFLTVHDIVRFARSREILCQGRGAAANSAVCFCLGITAVDPSRINLLFERFISRERNEPPDIDIDFEHERREEVFQYIYNTYGRTRAALVCEVVTYRTKSAAREVTKALGLPPSSSEQLLLTLRELAEQDSDEKRAKLLESFAQHHPRALLALKLSQELIGFPRHLSQHVGGFVISETPLSEIVPIEHAAMEGRTVIEWDKDDIEAMGMLKIDCLALGMLSCIRKSLALLGGLKLYEVPPEDSRVYDMICRADTIGVFQIESRAQMTMLPRLRPRCFYDLVIEVAIVRPGPIQGGMVHPFLRRRTGQEKPYYPSEAIKRVLGPTLGVPIFQEQAMELVIVAAGFTPGEADQLRRAMASWKKNKNAIRAFEEKIITGMLKHGYSRAFAEQCFQQIKGFGEYGFPQSHAASFAHLVYVSAWIKRHHPAIFCASLINSQPMGFYQPSQIFQDAARHGIEILPIDINASHWDCTIEQNPHGRSAVRVGMRLVRGLSRERALALIQHRKHNWTSIAQIWREARPSTATLTLLAHADAFQSLGLSRQQALWEIRRYRDHSLPLIEAIEKTHEVAPLPHIPQEIEMLSDYHNTTFSLRAHPMSFLREHLLHRGIKTSKELREECRHGERISLAGIVLIRQRPPTAAGFVFLTVEDEFGTANLIIKPDLYRQYRTALYESIYLLVRGRVQHQEGVIHLMVEAAENLRPNPENNIKIVQNYFSG